MRAQMLTDPIPAWDGGTLLGFFAAIAAVMLLCGGLTQLYKYFMLPIDRKRPKRLTAREVDLMLERLEEMESK